MNGLASEELDPLNTGKLAYFFPQVAEPYLTTLGRQSRQHVVELRATWTNLALGQGPIERTFAVVLGYAVVGMLLSLYLNILTVGNVRSAGKAVRNAVRQQLLIAKVCFRLYYGFVLHSQVPAGRDIHSYRIGHIPLQMRCGLRPVHNVALSPGHFAFTPSLLRSSTLDSHLLPLACRDDVHVRLSGYSFNISSSFPQVFLCHITLWLSVNIAPGCYVVHQRSSRPKFPPNPRYS